jgi:GT2 family glycosyltransferase
VPPPATPSRAQTPATRGQMAEDAGPSPAAGTLTANIGVIVVTWNRREDVSGVLRALAAQRYPRERLDVVIIDNASSDGTTEHLARAWRAEMIVQNPTTDAHRPDFQFPAPNGHHPAANAGGFGSLTIVRNHHNHGGCGGFNTGLAFVEQALDAPNRARRPDYVWLVDDDVDLPPDALQRLVETAQADTTIGIVGSRAVNFHDRETTIETTIYFNHERGRMEDAPIPSSRFYEEHRRWMHDVGATKGQGAGPFTGLREVDVVSACSLLARWSAVRKIGFWDYRYFIYCDDADWCLRFARAGYRVVCNLDAVVYHTPWYQKLTPARLYYSQRNIVWVLQKILPPGRVKYATFRWLASIMYDCLQASWHRRIFHARIIRRTAADIVANRGGKLAQEGPERTDAAEALEAAGALRPGARVAVLCTIPGACGWAGKLREHVRAWLARHGREGDEPQWVDVVRNDLEHEAAQDPKVQRIVYSRRLRSRLLRQWPLLRRPARAVVVFDQTNDFPLLRGAHNLHIDLKWPTQGQLERDGLLPRLGFLAGWVPLGFRVVFHSLLVRPYKSPDKYG